MDAVCSLRMTLQVSAPMGRFDILESTGSCSLYLTWDIRHADTDSIKLNDHQMLHRTAPHSTNRLRASTSA